MVDKNRKDVQSAMFGAGCFWGVEETFRKFQGVTSTEVGYSGGTIPKPTYEDVCRGQTGHAEVVFLEYDPQEVSYEVLLNVFWDCHNPTTLHRQGPDIGSQYRSAIYFFDPQQRKIAQQSKDTLEKSGRFRDKIVTEITPASQFWRAEEYHQKYFQKHGLDSCHL